MKLLIKLLISALCGLISFFIDFVLIPQTVALPDLVWIVLMFLLPVLTAICLLGRNRAIHPIYVWAGLPMQYLLLCIFAEGVSKNLGISLSGGLSGLTYVYEATVWPLGITFTQFLMLLLLRWKMKNRQ